MHTFARLRDPERGSASLECAHNRELEADLEDTQLFIVLSEDAHRKFNVDYDNAGEVLIYSPHFMKEYSCAWVGQTIDFDFFDEVGIV